MRDKPDSFWGNIFKTDRPSNKAEWELLKKIPIFGEMGSRELLQIDGILHRREYSANETIFIEGDPGLGMYIIEEGIVEILCGPDRQCLAELKGGEFFGELSLLDDSPRTASAVAKTRCKLLSFFQPDLFDFLDRKPRLGIKITVNLARVIGERLRRSNEALREFRLNAKS
jgi:CRP/FNR family transcriptional regulator, cyclic AMP receptor protein